MCSHVAHEGLPVMTAEADNSLGQKGVQKKNGKGTILLAVG